MEVEEEIQEGVREQLGFTLPSLEDRIKQDYDEEEDEERNNNSSSRRGGGGGRSRSTMDDIMTNLLLTTNADGYLQFETHDRGAMEL